MERFHCEFESSLIRPRAELSTLMNISQGDDLNLLNIPTTPNRLSSGLINQLNPHFASENLE